MKNVFFVVILVLLYGCGSEPFTSGFGAVGVETDSGLPLGTGGSMATSTGGAPGAGGHVGVKGGATATGGAPEVDAGGSTGGAPGTGGVVATGGSTATGGTDATGGAAVVDAGCTLVTHDNGAGQTWQDCVPLGTLDAVQAVKACQAWCAPKAWCTCYSGDVDVLGNGSVTSAVYGRVSTVEVAWLWESPYAGDTRRASPVNAPLAKVGTWN